MQNSRLSGELPISGANLVYGYKPSVMGAASEFRLTDDGIEWSVGRGSGLLPYAKVRRLRMSFRPAHMQSHRFVTTLWADGAPKLKIVSTSWKSMMQQDRLDKSYSAFIAELHRRLAHAGSAALFEQGTNPFIHWIGVIAFAALNVALVGLTVRALQDGVKGAAAFIVLFMALFLWQGGDFVRRNRPGVYRPDAPPELLMPKGKSFFGV